MSNLYKTIFRTGKDTETAMHAVDTVLKSGRKDEGLRYEFLTWSHREIQTTEIQKSRSSEYPDHVELTKYVKIIGNAHADFGGDSVTATVAFRGSEFSPRYSHNSTNDEWDRDDDVYDVEIKIDTIKFEIVTGKGVEITKTYYYEENGMWGMLKQ